MSSAPSIYFVYVPPQARFTEAKKVINSVCTCRIISGKGRTLFARVESGDIMAATHTKFEEDATLKIEPSNTITEEVWDRISHRSRRSKNGGKPDAEGAPKRTSHRKEAGDKTPPAEERKRYFSIFVTSPGNKVKLQDVVSYFIEKLNVTMATVDIFEGEKEFCFLRFDTLDECRAARAAFNANPLPDVTVKPALPRGGKRNHPDKHDSA